jgi:quercetin dioxygenase-like cupin family protein
MADPNARLRPPPAERFAGQEHKLDLDAALERLRAEPHAANSGHRQVTVFHRGHVRIVLFAFEAGGRLPEHAAPGLVTIHALRGALRVRTAEADHAIGAGQMVVLDTGVRHDVEASEESDMLLTVHFEPRH